MRGTTRSTRTAAAGVALALMVGLGAAACSSSSSDDAATTTTAVPTTPTTAPTSVAPATSAPSTSQAPSTAPSTGSTPTTSAVLAPGQPCALGSNPDCIDPDGDGKGVYLIGGGACVSAARKAGFDPSSCADLDGDGRAGYPDSG